MILISLSILIILVTVLLYKVYLINESVLRLKELFIDYENRKNVLNIPHELALIKNALSPLQHYWPLRYYGDKLIWAKNYYIEETKRVEKKFLLQELSEIEKFALKGSPSSPFLPSMELQASLKNLIFYAVSNRLLVEWHAEYVQLLMDITSGKTTIQQAERKVRVFCPGIDSRLVDNDPRFNELYNLWAEHWEADKWPKRLEELRKKIS